MKVTKILLSVFLVFLMSFAAFSQTHEQKLMIDGKYEKASKSLRKILKENPEDPYAHFTLARLYYNEYFKEYNLENAYNSVKRARLYLNTLSPEKKGELVKSGVTESAMDELTDRINYKVYLKVKEKNTYDAVQSFLEKHTETDSLTLQANELKKELFYSYVLKINTIDAYASYMKAFPESSHFNQIKNKHDQLVYNGSILKGELQEYINFAVKYPDNNFRDKALEKVISVYERNNREDELEYFVNEFATSSHAGRAWKSIFKKYDHDGELSTLDYMLSRYPEFPQTENYFVQAMSLAAFAWQIGLTQAGAISGYDYDTELDRRLSREKAKSGDLQFSLMWNNYNDLDLICIDPDGNELNYKNKGVPSGGYLDVDMNWIYTGDHDYEALLEAGHDLENIPKSSDKPVENIYWGESLAKEGIYKIYVRHVKNFTSISGSSEVNKDLCKDPTDYVVRVQMHGKKRNFKGKISYVPDNEKVLVAELEYFKPKKDLLTGLPEIDYSKYREYIRRAAPRELAYVALQKLIARSVEGGDFAGAAKICQDLSPLFKESPAMVSKIDGLIAILGGEKFGVVRKNLGLGINSKGNEYYPVLSGNDSVLYFCGSNRPDNIGGEDIFMSELQESNGESSWSAAKPFGFLNTANDNEAALSLSTDGNTMILFSEGDLFYSSKTEDGWSEPEKFPESINSEYWEGDAMISSDGKSLLFASARPTDKTIPISREYYHGHNQHSSDLYVSHLTEDGWSDPVNLGDAVNTPFCDRSPYLHPDMKTMLFSSDGHSGLGKLDVFMVKRTSQDSWTEWSVPVNLGVEINTSGEDWGYKLNSRGDYTFFSAENPNPDYKEDLYSVPLPPQFRSEVVVAISGLVQDSKGNSLSGTIIWEDLETNQEVGKAYSDPNTGKFLIILPAGKHYGYFAQKEGYYPVSENIDLREEKGFRTINEVITMINIDELKAMKAVKINNLFFDTGKTELRPESFPELDRLAGLLEFIVERDSETKIEIAGHTDNVGSLEDNQALSDGRAKAVSDYLLSKGVPATAIASKGYGESLPTATNDTDEGRQTNRRVEFKFIQ